jgi:hypothetical protein
MRNEVKHISSYVFSPTDKLLFDANIWLLIYGPQGNPSANPTKVYSGALAKALQAKSHLYIDVLILSEIVNRYARLRHSLLSTDGKASDKFKEFRNTSEFKSVAEEIADAAQQILKNCYRTSSGVEAVDIDSIICRVSRHRGQNKTAESHDIANKIRR